MAILLKSNKPGFHFRISAYKPDRGQGYVVAQEVVLERNAEGRIVSYAMELFNPEYRTVRTMVQGRMTDKNKAATLREVIAHLTDNGMVEPHQEVIGDLN
jgi:hypothetical protein